MIHATTTQSQTNQRETRVLIKLRRRLQSAADDASIHFARTLRKSYAICERMEVVIAIQVCIFHQCCLFSAHDRRH